MVTMEFLYLAKGKVVEKNPSGFTVIKCEPLFLYSFLKLI